MEDKRSFFIMCMADFYSGGPELLHQLASELKRLGLSVYMFYVKNGLNDTQSPVHVNFKHYNIPFVFNVVDDPSNTIIFPEIYLMQVKQYPLSRKYIWWLSIDFGLKFLDVIERLYNPKNLLSRIFCKLILFFKKLPAGNYFYDKYNQLYLNRYISWTNSNGIIHLAQSYYALDFLSKRKVIKLCYLSDYLRQDFLDKAVYHITDKRDIVVYNPKKGLVFTKKIMEACNGLIKFVPLENMTIEEVKRNLLLAKVYIDFGHHPGKDRIPREAAMLGCCIITSRLGSAGFFRDLPILDEYKFTCDDGSVVAIVDEILDCMKNYHTAINDFDDFRQMILKEYGEFKECVANIFIDFHDV